MYCPQGLARVRRALTFGLAFAVAGFGQGASPEPESMLAAIRSIASADSNPGRRAALESILEGLSLPYEVEPFQVPMSPDDPRTEGANLVVTIGGSADGDVVIGAHYDAARLEDGTLSPGAVDNAASLVVLSRLSGRLSGVALRHRFRIVFFDMEEIGLLGSRAFLERHRGDPIRAGVNLDVNGYGDTIFFGPASAPGNERLYELILDYCGVRSLSCLEFPAYPVSDYLSFQSAGIPNISFSVLPEDEARDLGTYMSGGRGQGARLAPRVLRLIHSPDDTPDQVEAAAMALSLDALTGFLLRLDQALD